MSTGVHFGCTKFTFDRISGHFRSIRNFNLFGNFWQNGWYLLFWMSEIHLWSHFWPFQIDTQLKFLFEIFYKMADMVHFGCPKFTLDRISGHFRSIGHFAFPKFTFDRNSLSTEIHFRSKFTFDRNSGHFRSIQNFIKKNRRPFWMSENHFGSHFWPFQIDRSFWMSENNFRMNFWPFQIDTQLFFFLIFWTKWSPAAILDGTTIYRIRPRYLDE